MMKSTLSGLVAALALAAPAAAETSLKNILRPSNQSNVMSFVHEAKKAGTLLTEAADTRIYGGRPAQQGTWPWQVSLHSTKNVGQDQHADPPPGHFRRG